MAVQDTIEREVFIRAGIEHVWSLVSKAGFWVGDELRFDKQAGEGETVVIETENYGDFPVIVDRLDPPRYAAYRWSSTFPGVEPAPGNSTLVEFSLVEQDGGVLVRLKESGFAALDVDEDVRLREYGDNAVGWDAQLAKLREAAERVPA